MSLGLDIGYEKQPYCKTAAEIVKLTHNYYQYIHVVCIRYLSQLLVHDCFKGINELPYLYFEFQVNYINRMKSLLLIILPVEEQLVFA